MASVTYTPPRSLLYDTTFSEKEEPTQYVINMSIPTVSDHSGVGRFSGASVALRHGRSEVDLRQGPTALLSLNHADVTVIKNVLSASLN